MVDNVSKGTLEKVLKEAFINLYENDIYLISFQNLGNDYHGSERAIVFRFGHYLQNIIDSENVLKEFNLDCEYNRDGYNSKCIPSYGNAIPDLIIHERGSNDNNFLIMEFKTHWNKENENDIKKIRGFMSKEYQYKYKYGIFVYLGKTLGESYMEWIQGGDSYYTYF